jgi:hypothetical protein
MFKAGKYSDTDKESFKLKLKAMRSRVLTKQEKFLRLMFKSQTTSPLTDFSKDYFGQIQSEIGTKSMFKGININEKRAVRVKKSPDSIKSSKSRTSTPEFFKTSRSRNSTPCSLKFTARDYKGRQLSTNCSYKTSSSGIHSIFSVNCSIYPLNGEINVWYL